MEQTSSARNTGAVCCIFLQRPSVYAMESNDASQSTAAQQPLHNALQTGAKQGSALEQDRPAGRSEHISSSLGIFNVLDDNAELSPAIREAMQHVLQQNPDSDSLPPESTSLQLSNQLEGTACLAWLPNGQVFGKTLPPPPPFCQPLAHFVTTCKQSNLPVQWLFEV